MRIALAAVAALVAVPLAAQDPAAVYQKQGSSFGFHVDTLVRYETTRDILTSPATDPTLEENQERWIFRARPRLEFGGDKFSIGVGGDFYYADEDNLVPPPPQTTLTLLRDNFDSRSARLDLAFVKATPISWMELAVGRFEMPVAFTEMIWDKDLRVQGASLALGARNRGSLERAAVTGLFSRASHALDDGGDDFFADTGVEMKTISGELAFKSGQSGSLQLVGSWVEWSKIRNMELPLRRQNPRLAGQYVREKYQVFDAVARLTMGGNLPVQLIGNMSWNVGDDPASLDLITHPKGQKGLWLAVVLGSLEGSRARAEYTYASVDRDATLAAYNADDFFWGTGWSGHRVELASRTRAKTSMHLVGEWLKFKDSAVVAERDHTVSRYRVEFRTKY